MILIYLSGYRKAKQKQSFKVSHYFCNYSKCDFKCISKLKIERHVEKVHFNKSLMKCERCEHQFWTHKQLSNHIKDSHKELFDRTTQLFRCDYNECKVQFDRYSKLLVHRIRHFGQKTFKCSDDYPSCEWTFFTILELKNHQMFIHKNEKPFICDSKGCERRFNQQKLLGFILI